MLLPIKYIFRYLLPVVCLWASLGTVYAEERADSAWLKRFDKIYTHDHKGNEDTLVAYAWKAFYLAHKHQDIKNQLLALNRLVNTTQIDSFPRYLAIVDTFPESLVKVKVYGSLNIRYYDRLLSNLNPKDRHGVIEDIIHKADSVYADSLHLKDVDAKTMYIFKNRRYLDTLVKFVKIDSQDSPFYKYLERLNTLVEQLPPREYPTKINTYLTTSSLAIEMGDYENGISISEQVIRGIMDAPHTANTFLEMKMANASICYYMCYQQIRCYDNVPSEMLARNWAFMNSDYGHKCLAYMNHFFPSEKLIPELYYFMAKGEYNKVISGTEKYITRNANTVDARQRFVELQNMAIKRCKQPKLYVDKLHRNFKYTHAYNGLSIQGQRVDYTSLFEITKVKHRIAADKTEQNKAAVLWSHLQLTAILLLVLLAPFGLLVMYFTNSRKKQLIRQLREETEHTIEEKQRTEEAKMMQTTSLDNMNHEIRSPLNSIVGFTELLLDNPNFDRDTKKEFSNQINTSSTILLQVINDVLDAAQLEAGQYKLENDYWAVHDLCSYAMNSMEHRLQSGVTLHLDYNLEVETQIYVDKVRLLQILLNFLSNACKHTPEGQIILTCGWADSAHTLVHFSVKDMGNGVPEDKQSQLFQRFAKLNHKVQGTGLGLNIAATLADLMGGEVGYDSDYKEGAKFDLVIPLRSDK